MGQASTLTLSASRISQLMIATAYIYLLAYIFLIGYSPILQIIPLASDDGFYYIKIARNLVAGYGFSFDQFSQTNGVHPLWLLMLIPLAAIGQSLSTEAFFRCVLIYQCLIVLAALTLINGACWRRWALPTLALTNALIVLIARPYLINGMESPVILLVGSLMLFWLARRPSLAALSGRDWLVLGVWMGLLVLARLDTIFIFLVMAVAYLMFARELPTGIRLQRVALFAIGLCLLLAPYLLFNKLYFGDFMPISGKLKSTFPYLTDVDFSFNRISWKVYLPLLSGLIYFILYFRDFARDSIAFLLICWWLGCGLHWLHTGLWMKWGVFNWHFVAYWILLVFALPLILHRFMSVAILREGVGFTLALMSLAVAFMSPPYRSAGEVWTQAAYRAALWARRHTAPDDVFAMKDAGAFGYFSERRVINLDGLVNDLEYQTVLKERRLNAYLKARKVKYLVQHAVNPYLFPTHYRSFGNPEEVIRGDYERTRLIYYSYLYGVHSEPVWLYRADEVYRSRHVDGVFLIWRLRY